jgi:hypothetical protein
VPEARGATNHDHVSVVRRFGSHRIPVLVRLHHRRGGEDKEKTVTLDIAWSIPYPIAVRYSNISGSSFDRWLRLFVLGVPPKRLSYLLLLQVLKTCAMRNPICAEGGTLDDTFAH